MRGLTPRKDVDSIPARTDTLANGLDHPLHAFKEGVVQKFDVIPASNTHDDIGGSVSDMICASNPFGS
jgi:hypothetical protein